MVTFYIVKIVLYLPYLFERYTCKECTSVSNLENCPLSSWDAECFILFLEKEKILDNVI